MGVRGVAGLEDLPAGDGAARPPTKRSPSCGHLADQRAVVGRRDGRVGLASGFQPGRLRLLDLSQRLLRRVTEGGAVLQVGDVGDVAAVFLAVEDVDVVVPSSLVLQCQVVALRKARQVRVRGRSRKKGSYVWCPPNCPASAYMAGTGSQGRSRLAGGEAQPSELTPKGGWG